MKVLHVITKGEIGGAQSHVVTLTRELLRQGVHAEVAIGGAAGSTLEHQLAASGIPVHRISELSNALRPVRMMEAVRALRRIVRDTAPDVLHAHSAMAGVVARLAGRLSGTPVVYTVHGFAFKAGNAWHRRAMAFSLEWALAPLTHTMICVSRHEARQAAWLPLAAKRVRVIHNGIEDTTSLQHTAAPPPAHPTSVVMVARMAAPKRPDLLLRAIAQLRKSSGDEIPTTFFGDGPDLGAHRALAEQLALKSAYFAGDVADAASRLSAHTLFVLMSDHEGLPISLIEAMRASMPIVASDLPGIRELLPHSEHALLVPPDAQALASALRQLIESPALRAAMGAAARQRFEQCFTAQRMVHSVRSVYLAATAPSL